MLAHACPYATESVISKQAEGSYEQTRSTRWLKTKCLQRQEFVIGGFTNPGGSRVGFGALLVGYYQDGRLKYAGRVGTGFAHDTLRQLHAELKQRKIDSPPFADPPRGSRARGVTWVEPKLVAEVEFTEWTNDNLLRHPSFQGLREDKPPEQIVRETAQSTRVLQERTMTKGPQAIPHTARSAETNHRVTVAGVQITHPDRVLYPEQGVTKQALAKFYESIADWILPYLADRPLTLVRCPRGRSGDCFYQKHLTDSLPEALQGVTIQERHKRAKYVALDDVAGLVSLVQMGVLEIHPWGAKADRPDAPDQIVFDLDPGPGVAWQQVVEAAQQVRDHVGERGLQCYVRTSGGKGLHVVLPIKKGPTWDDAKSFAKSIATAMADADSDAYIATASKAKRKGRIFIDYLRNSRGATSVASYSTRARPGAPVAVPLRWDELATIDGADQYTVSNVKRRLAALKGDPWKGFFSKRQEL